MEDINVVSCCCSREASREQEPQLTRASFWDRQAVGFPNKKHYFFANISTMANIEIHVVTCLASFHCPITHHKYLSSGSVINLWQIEHLFLSFISPSSRCVINLQLREFGRFPITVWGQSKGYVPTQPLAHHPSLTFAMMQISYISPKIQLLKL